MLPGRDGQTSSLAVGLPCRAGPYTRVAAALRYPRLRPLADRQCGGAGARSQGRDRPARASDSLPCARTRPYARLSPPYPANTASGRPVREEPADIADRSDKGTTPSRGREAWKQRTTSARRQRNAAGWPKESSTKTTP